ncbi:MAG: hypothetical protein AAFX99_20195, partial [Myxococcota bacterium]
AELAQIQPAYDASPESLFCTCLPDPVDRQAVSVESSADHRSFETFQGPFDLRPERVQGYRLAVEKVLSRRGQRFAACLEGATEPVTVDFLVSHSGEAFRAFSDDPKRDACLMRVMQTARYPQSCMLPSRALRLKLKPKASNPVGAVTYRIFPGPRSHASCEVASDFDPSDGFMP